MLALSSFVAGLRGFPGGMRLAIVRAVGLYACLAPARALIERELEEALAGHPSPEGPLRFEIFELLVSEGAGTFAGAALVGAALFFIWDQLLTASGLALADGAGRRVWSTVWTTGWEHLPRFVRVGLVTWAAQALVLVLAGKVVGALDGVGARAGWTGLTRVVTMPALVVVAACCALSAIGAWGRMARVLVVVDGRAHVLRALLDAARALVRAPGLVVMFMLTTIAAQAVLGALLSTAAWPPDGGAASVAASVTVVVVETWVWITFLGAFRRLYDDGPFDAVRATADRPLPLIGAVTGRFG